MTPPHQTPRPSRVYIAVLAVYCVVCLILFGFTSAIDWKWISRSDLEPWYSSVARLVSESYQDRAAAELCKLSLSQDCAPVATPEKLTGLRCWGAAGMSWCVDLGFTTATLVWLLLSTAIYAATCVVLPNQTLGPRPQDPLAKRNDALIQLGLNLVFAVWMVWDAYAALETTKPANGAACTSSNPDCVFDLSDTVPGGVAAGAAALLFAFAIAQLLYRHRRDLAYRADPVTESQK